MRIGELGQTRTSPYALQHTTSSAIPLMSALRSPSKLQMRFTSRWLLATVMHARCTFSRSSRRPPPARFPRLFPLSVVISRGTLGCRFGPAPVSNTVFGSEAASPLPETVEISSREAG